MTRTRKLYVLLSIHIPLLVKVTDETEGRHVYMYLGWRWRCVPWATMAAV